MVCRASFSQASISASDLMVRLGSLTNCALGSISSAAATSTASKRESMAATRSANDDSDSRSTVASTSSVLATCTLGASVRVSFWAASRLLRCSGSSCCQLVSASRRAMPFLWRGGAMAGAGVFASRRPPRGEGPRGGGVLLQVGDLGHQDFGTGQPIGLCQQALEGVPGGQALVDSVGDICPCVDGGTEFVALVVQGQQLLVAGGEADFFQPLRFRACRTWGLAPGAVGQILRAEQELRHVGQLFALLSAEADLLQRLTNLDALRR